MMAAALAHCSQLGWPTHFDRETWGTHRLHGKHNSETLHKHRATNVLQNGTHTFLRPITLLPGTKQPWFPRVISKTERNQRLRTQNPPLCLAPELSVCQHDWVGLLLSDYVDIHWHDNIYECLSMELDHCWNRQCHWGGWDRMSSHAS